jgi:hypothetical protein
VFSHPDLFNDPRSDGPAGGLELLHDREADPHMTENLIAERPDVANSLRADLLEWHWNTATTSDAAGNDPLVEMTATAGPFLYVDPDELAAFYRATDRSEAQQTVAEVARSAGGFS